MVEQVSDTVWCVMLQAWDCRNEEPKFMDFGGGHER